MTPLSGPTPISDTKAFKAGHTSNYTDCVTLEDARNLERLLAEAVGALTTLEKALRTDSRAKSILADMGEYHLDGQAMYHAINTARAVLARIKAAKEQI